jgi:signal transduction histidine kinase
MTAFWENVWCSYELRWLKWISGRDGCQSKWLLIRLKNIEQDIREISHDLNREKSELINNFVARQSLEEQRKTFQTKLVSNIDSSIKWESLANSVKINLYRIMQVSSKY